MISGFYLPTAPVFKHSIFSPSFKTVNETFIQFVSTYELPTIQEAPFQVPGCSEQMVKDEVTKILGKKEVEAIY